MIASNEPLPPGWCQHCRVECGDKLGSQIYPHKPELAEKVIWVCPFCGARVGTHEEGPSKGQPLGTAANIELRKARQLLHQRMVDPLWQHAFQHPDYESARREPNEAERRKALAIIKRTARKRVYEYLAAHLGLEFHRCHVALFDLEQCRSAWRALQGRTYADIRDWTKANRQSQTDQAASGSAK